MPAFVQSAFPFILTHRGAVHVDVIERLTAACVGGMSFAKAADAIRTAIVSRHSRDHLSYLDYFRHQQRLGKVQAGEPAFFGSATDAEYLPSSGYLIDVWLDAMEEPLKYAQQHMNTLKGQILCADHCFEAANYVRDAANHKLYAAIFSIWNEWGQVIAQWFTATQSHKELEPGIKSVAARYPPGQVSIPIDLFCPRQYFPVCGPS